MMRDSASDRIERQKIKLRGHREFMALGPIMDRIGEYIAVPPTVCSTAAVNGKAMMYNPAFIEALPSDELRGLLVHEYFHVKDGHHLRVGDRDPETANIAMDHMVNNQIIKTEAYRSGFIKLPSLNGQIKPLCDPKYADQTKWSYELVYRDIYQPPPPTEQPEGPGEEGEGDGDEDTEQPQDTNGAPGNGDGEAGDGDEQDEGDDGEGGGGDAEDDGGSNADGDGGGQGQGQDQSESPSGGGSGAPERPQNFPPQMPGGGEVWPYPETDMMDRQQEKQEINEALSQGEFIQKSMGLGGGTSFIEAARAALDEEIGDWEFLRQHLATIYADLRTWAAPNVIYMDHGYLPARKKSSGVLHCVFDTSGSMSHEELSACFANVSYICNELDIRTVKLAYVDHMIRPNESGEIWTEFDVAAGEEPQFIVTGRGGTRFEPIFHSIDEEQEDVTALLYFTDGEGWCPCPEPDFPVFWCTTNIPVMGFGDYPEFGETVNIVATHAYRPWWQV